MKHPVKKQINKLKRKNLELNQKNLELNQRFVDLQNTINNLVKELQKNDPDKSIPGQWTIRIGKAAPYRSEVIACQIQMSIDQYIHEIMGDKRAFQLQSLVRTHLMDLIRFMENEIIKYAEQEYKLK